MARIDYWQYLLDDQGRPLQYAEVRVYLAGTLTEADIYLDATFGSVTKSSDADLKTDKYGFVQFWIGDRWEVEGGYNVDQQFKVRWYNTIDSEYEQIDNLYVFTPVKPIDTSDTIEGNPRNRDRNKVISNTQGYDWDTHTDSTLPSGNPHGIAPVTWFDLGSLQSKVISNKLGYQMYQLATTSSITPVDISASDYYTTTISSWTASGGYYYADVAHNHTNFYPVVRIVKDSNDEQLVPYNVESIDADTTRIWVEENVNMRVVIIG